MLARMLHQSLTTAMTERRLVDGLPVKHIADVDVGASQDLDVREGWLISSWYDLIVQFSRCLRLPFKATPISSPSSGAGSLQSRCRPYPVLLNRAVTYLFALRDRRPNFDTTILAQALPAFELAFVVTVGHVELAELGAILLLGWFVDGHGGDNGLLISSARRF
jgi:hypothetical protein